MRALLFALGTALLAPAAFATTAVAWRLEEMARQADVVALAKVASTESHWRGGRIYTEARLVTERLVKGEGVELLVEIEGGVVGGIGQEVSGAPRFEVGERVAVFLERHPQRPVYRVMGMSQGKLHLEGDEVVRDLRGMRLLVPDPAGDLRPAPEDGPARRPLEGFLHEVEAALAK